MNNLFVYFFIPFSLVILLGLLAGCGSVPVSDFEKNVNVQRNIRLTRFEAETLRHEQWVQCVKRRGMDGEGC